MRYNQEAYYQKYGSSVLFKYAPKSDVWMVVFLFAVVGSILSWFIQLQHWQNIANKLIKASVEDLGLREGGTPESKEIRQKALKILAEREKEEKEKAQNGTATNGSSGKKKKKQPKLTTSERKKQQEESLRPIIAELVKEIEDFGAGYHKPTWRDLFVVKMATFPFSFVGFVLWNGKYFMNRLRGLDLNDEEREVLTRRAVGEVNWASSSEEERQSMSQRNLWLADNMVEWEEEQEVKTLSASDQKRYNRLKKKGKQGKVEDWKMD